MSTQPKLTPSQSVIADHKDGPAIVLAGAGSGKTATLIERCKRLTHRHMISPTNQLVLTFSRKAATEIRNRLKLGLAEQAKDLTVDTFHGFGYQFLRRQKEMYGLAEDQNWVILDSTDQNRLIMELATPLIDEAQLDKKKFRPFMKKQFSAWSLMKQDVIIPQSPQDAHAKLYEICQKQGIKIPFPSWLAVAAKTLHAYEQYKSDNHYLDYDDLITKPLIAIVKHPEISEALSRRFTHIMVDESQDTNLAQYLMIKHIGKHHKNVVMVGDDDQSIYGWRGARVANLRKFMLDFGAKEVRLEENFRSQPKIVQAASKLISHNTSRLVKNPYSNREEALDPALHCFPDDRAMGSMLMKHVQFMRSRGAAWSDIAILYRTNRMALLLEPHFKRAGIPYRVVGGMSFFERAEVKAAIQCIRLVEKPDDWEALKNLVPYLDGIGKKGMADFVGVMKQHNLSLFDLVEDTQNLPVSGKVAEKLAAFYLDLLDHTLVAGNKHGDAAMGVFVDWLAEGPLKVLEREKDDAIRYRRQMNLDLLKQDLEASCTAEDWMQYFLDTPLSDSLESTEDEDCVTLSTVHRSKGLEWPYVIVAGFSDGLMPFDPSNIGVKSDDTSEEDSEDGGKPEEERRLGYVAMTRAEHEVHFYHADVYNFPQSPVGLEVSRYAREMGLTIRPAVTSQAKATQSIHAPSEDTGSVSAFMGSFKSPSL